MSLENWLIFIVTDFFVAISPGPAVLLVAMQGFRYGLKPSCFSSLGISACNLLFYILSSLGIGALILATGDLFEYIKAGGAFYLVFSGIVMFYKAFKEQSSFSVETAPDKNNLNSFIQGFVTQLANPKAILFFVVLLPQFIDFSKEVTQQFVILGITTVILETSILMLYGWTASKGKKLAADNKKRQKWQNCASGFVLFALGIYLFCGNV